MPFYQPIVGGPGMGDPMKSAAAKAAYARALGPAAMSYLMGFVPGDPGWRGDPEPEPAARGDGEEEGGDPAARGAVGTPRHPGADPSSSRRGYGLDPRAFAFDPNDPAASLTTSRRSVAASSRPSAHAGDGQQSSEV